MQIYLARNNQQAGPYTVEQLNQMLASQQVVLTDLIWHQGMSEWKPLGEVTQGQQHYYPEGYQAPTAVNSPFQSAAAAKAAPVQGSKLAPFSKRIYAKIIDMLLWLPASFIPTAFMNPEQQAAMIKLQQTPNYWSDVELQHSLLALFPQSVWITMLVYILLLLVLQAVLLQKTGQSVGKKVMGIIIVDANTDQKVGINRVFILRSLLFTLIFIFIIPYSVIFAITDYSFAFSSKQRQALHDRLCKTKVIEKNA